MKTALECIPCFVRQAEEALVQCVENEEQRQSMLRILLREISEADWSRSPPEVAQHIHRVIRRESGCADPYAGIKHRMNAMAAHLLPSIRDAIARQADPREAAVRIAIAGNLLDAGAKSRIGIDALPEIIESVWSRPLHGDIEALFETATNARNILYLADNAGEIFFDRLLIEMLPPGKVSLCVRGAPIINDATRADAIAAHLPEIVPVFDNGSDAPGTLLDNCSEHFRMAFAQADMIIAKGQGNYETLSGGHRPVFFLFTVKCPLVAASCGAPMGTLVAST